MSVALDASRLPTPVAESPGLKERTAPVRHNGGIRIADYNVAGGGINEHPAHISHLESIRIDIRCESPQHHGIYGSPPTDWMCQTADAMLEASVSKNCLLAFVTLDVPQLAISGSTASASTSILLMSVALYASELKTPRLRASASRPNAHIGRIRCVRILPGAKEHLAHIRRIGCVGRRYDCRKHRHQRTQRRMPVIALQSQSIIQATIEGSRNAVRSMISMRPDEA